MIYLPRNPVLRAWWFTPIVTIARKGKRLTKGKRGFTIIELVVVLSILGVMLLLATPNIGRWLPRYRLRGAIRNVASTMQLSRMGAIRESRAWYIQFNTAAQTYTVFNSGPDAILGNVDDISISTTSLADYPTISFGDNGYGSWLGEEVGDGITFDQNRVVFNPNGTVGPVVGAVVGSVYLRNNVGGASVAAIRWGATGAVRVRHWDGDSWEP